MKALFKAALASARADLKELEASMNAAPGVALSALLAARDRVKDLKAGKQVGQPQSVARELARLRQWYRERARVDALLAKNGHKVRQAHTPVVSGPQLEMKGIPAPPPPAPPQSENERDRNTGNRAVVSFRLQASTIDALDRLVEAGKGADPPVTRTWIIETLLRDHLKAEGFLK